MTMKRIVVSAVNFSEGGPLTVLRACLSTARDVLPAKTEIIALVHRDDLITTPGIRTIAFPDTKTSWAKRLMLEYRGFKTLSRDLQPDFWLSLHDVSPRLNGERQAVYCHNPAAFFRPTWRDIGFERSLLAFSLAYRFLYRFNMRANCAVIVQQEWMRQKLRPYARPDAVIVAHPDVADLPGVPRSRGEDGKCVFLYPTLPRAFKNIEVLGEALAKLPPEDVARIEIRVTIDGQENAYARAIVDRYARQPGMTFIGRQVRARMAQEYADCDAVAFPSRLETWGLPISEAKAFGKPILAAELPYARETMGSHDAAAFVAPNDAIAWRDAFAAAINGRPLWHPVTGTEPDAPFAPDWRALWMHLVRQGR